MQKDVYYYRNANKDLKTKLREVVAVNHKLAKSLEKNIAQPKVEGGYEADIPAYAAAVEKI